MCSTAACHSACAAPVRSSVAFPSFDAYAGFTSGAAVVGVRACAATVCAAEGHALMEATMTPITMPTTELVSISASLTEINESTADVPPRSAEGKSSPRSGCATLLDSPNSLSFA